MIKDNIAKRVKKNVPAIWETYPLATGAVFGFGVFVGVVLMWLFGG